MLFCCVQIILGMDTTETAKFTAVARSRASRRGTEAYILYQENLVLDNSFVIERCLRIATIVSKAFADFFDPNRWLAPHFEQHGCFCRKCVRPGFPCSAIF